MITSDQVEAARLQVEETNGGIESYHRYIYLMVKFYDEGYGGARNFALQILRENRIAKEQGYD